MFTRRQALKALIAGINGLIAMTLAVPVLGYLLTPLLRKTGAAAWVALGPAADFRGPEPRRVDFRYTSEVGYTAESVSGFAYVVPGGDNDAPSSCRRSARTWAAMWCGAARSNDSSARATGANTRRTVGTWPGPPPRPLDRLPVRIENGVLMIQAGKET